MITNIKLKNVRKFSEINLDINSNNVILQGGNATGKTTILESISSNIANKAFSSVSSPIYPANALI